MIGSAETTVMVAKSPHHSTGERPQKSASGPAAGEPAAWPASELQRLREENEMLRQSAQTFGALAERLHEALQRERQPFGRPRVELAHAG